MALGFVRDGEPGTAIRRFSLDVSYTEGDTEGETTRKHDFTSYCVLYTVPSLLLCWNSIQTRGDPRRRGTIAGPFVCRPGCKKRVSGVP